jgi:hypothetical protein
MNVDALNFHIISPDAILNRAKCYLKSLNSIEQSFKLFFKFIKKFQKRLLRLTKYYDETFLSLNHPAQMNNHENFIKNHVDQQTKMKLYQDNLNVNKIRFKNEINFLKQNFKKEISLKKLTRQIEFFFKNYKIYLKKSLSNEKFYKIFSKFYDYYSNVCLKLNKFETKKLNLYLNLVNIFNFQNNNTTFDAYEINSKNLIENWLNANQIEIKIDKNICTFSNNNKADIVVSNEDEISFKKDESIDFEDSQFNKIQLKHTNIEAINIESAYSMNKIIKDFEKYLTHTV